MTATTSESVTRSVTGTRAERHLVTLDTFANGGAAELERANGVGDCGVSCALPSRQSFPGTTLAQCGAAGRSWRRKGELARFRFMSTVLSKETNNAFESQAA